MSGDAALESCADLCAGYTYMGLQGVDQCFCGNVHGAYGQLPDAACGTAAEAVDQPCCSECMSGCCL